MIGLAEIWNRAKHFKLNIMNYDVPCKLYGDTDRLPIIALSANAVKGMEQEFLNGGMNDFLPKPINMEMLASLLRKWLPRELIRENS